MLRDYKTLPHKLVGKLTQPLMLPKERDSVYIEHLSHLLSPKKHCQLAISAVVRRIIVYYDQIVFLLFLIQNAVSFDFIRIWPQYFLFSNLKTQVRIIRYSIFLKISITQS